jgi:hypothetical protein
MASLSVELWNISFKDGSVELLQKTKQDDHWEYIKDILFISTRIIMSCKFCFPDSI